MAAVVALLQVTPEGRRAAALEGAHDAALRRRERSAVRLTVGFAVAAKHLEPLPTAADPWPGARSTGVERARAPPPQAAAADQAGFGWRTPWKWRCVGSGPWWPGCDDPAAVEWCARRCPIPADERQRRGAANGG